MPLSFSAAPITWISVVNGEHFPVLGLALTTNGLQSIVYTNLSEWTFSYFVAEGALGVLIKIGIFLLTAKKNATLVISYIGYLTQEVRLQGKTQVTIQLTPDRKHWTK